MQRHRKTATNTKTMRQNDREFKEKGAKTDQMKRKREWKVEMKNEGHHLEVCGPLAPWPLETTCSSCINYFPVLAQATESEVVRIYCMSVISHRLLLTANVDTQICYNVSTVIFNLYSHNRRAFKPWKCLNPTMNISFHHILWHGHSHPQGLIPC